MSKDEFYANTAARLDTILGDSADMWVKVARAKKEYDSAYNKESFYTWLQEKYGLKLQFTPNGELALANEIIDPHKFTLFLLKFSND